MGLAGHHPNSTLSKAPICPKNGVHLNVEETGQWANIQKLLLTLSTPLA